ncbi:MAG: glycosyltransferase family protein [Candidatus Peribacteraceae bacterium]|nr:glycosyltransferase family protein [Candidatus Peribacteraceae bacterium]
MKIGAIIQARMSSTRLPGKIMKDLSGQPLLWHVIDRVRTCRMIDEIVLASTANEKDEVLERFAKENDIKLFRGSEEDVLERYLHAAKKYNIDMIVRITSDCPLIDPKTVDKLIEKHIEYRADYSSNILERTYPRGLDTEVFSTVLLEEIDKIATEKFQREHVTPYFYQKPSKYSLNNLVAEKKLNRPDYRLCVDTIEDLELIKLIYGKLYNPPDIVSIENVIDLLDKEPGLAQININIKQKELID